MRALDLDGRPLAMLVNFLCPPGGFSFKTAFDEGYARFSPGVLLQQANLDLLDHPRIMWVDSCAAPGHPMIDSVWRERRALVGRHRALGRRTHVHQQVRARAAARAQGFDHVPRREVVEVALSETPVEVEGVAHLGGHVLGVRVAQAADRHARDAVQIALALRIPQPATFAAHERDREPGVSVHHMRHNE